MINAVHKVAQQYVNDAKFSGIEWQIEKAGKILNSGACGYANAKLKKKIPQQAIYRIYSMTKPIISVLAMMLIERGKLHLYDSVERFNPKFRDMKVLFPNGLMEKARTPITLQHLLTHQAGFSYDFLLGCPIAAYYRANEITADGHRDLDQMISVLSELPLAFHPGDDWRYSVATDVLAHVLERATNRRIDDLLKLYIFDPLEMNETSFCLTDVQLGRLMTLYGKQTLSDLPPLRRLEHELEEQDPSQSHPTQSNDFRRGGFGLYSTISDYCRFSRMLLTGKTLDDQVLLSPTSLEMMHGNRVPDQNLPLRIGDSALPGYGWNLSGRVMIDTSKALFPHATLNEFGWAGAASTFFWVDPDNQITGVIMTQFIGSTYLLADDMITAFYAES
ncbi:beta-lactamase family protein [Paracoccaceae bacterium]|jgi:CubicO group peptidase (beta-lactamase class C family)|nr:beta-lactamase family protein [Paracoccaceae bacterium]